mmetsp:Transcript_36219/g.76352  ORF Transcript_36219/g.76352 Transcript_36219/m.76352 type:complete len:83 (+) Transcript_36219:61-309(+)
MDSKKEGETFIHNNNDSNDHSSKIRRSSEPRKFSSRHIPLSIPIHAALLSARATCRGEDDTPQLSPFAAEAATISINITTFK